MPIEVFCIYKNYKLCGEKISRLLNLHFKKHAFLAKIGDLKKILMIKAGMLNLKIISMVGAQTPLDPLGHLPD